MKRQNTRYSAAAALRWDFETGYAEGAEEETGRQPQPPRVFLLDDDPIFCKLMEKVAKKNGIPITICSRLEEFGTQETHRDFDVAVLDYFIEDMTGPQIVPLLDNHPVVMVSRNEACVEADQQWPETVKKFIAKRQGPQAILEAAITLSRPS